MHSQDTDDIFSCIRSRSIEGVRALVLADPRAVEQRFVSTPLPPAAMLMMGGGVNNTASSSANGGNPAVGLTPLLLASLLMAAQSQKGNTVQNAQQSSRGESSVDDVDVSAFYSDYSIYFEIIRILIEDGGASPDQRLSSSSGGGGGETALHVAAAFGDFKLLFYLARSGGNPLCRTRCVAAGDGGGLTAIDFAKDPSSFSITIPPPTLMVLLGGGGTTGFNMMGCHIVTPIHQTCADFLNVIVAKGVDCVLGFTEEEMLCFGNRMIGGGRSVPADGSDGASAMPIAALHQPSPFPVRGNIDLGRLQHALFERRAAGNGGGGGGSPMSPATTTTSSSHSPHQSPLANGVMRVVHDTIADIVIQGSLPYAFKGAVYSTPILCYVSKRCINPCYFDATPPYLRGTADVEGGGGGGSTSVASASSLPPPLISTSQQIAREANFRVRIDTSNLGELMINPKATYIDARGGGGVITIPTGEVSRRTDVAEFLLFTVAPLFATVPPLCSRKKPNTAMPIPQPLPASAAAAQRGYMLAGGDNTTFVSQRLIPIPYAGAAPMATGGYSSPSSSPFGGSSSSASVASSSVPPSGIALMKQMALACSSFCKGRALRYDGATRSIVGFIPIKVRPSSSAAPSVTTFMDHNSAIPIRIQLPATAATIALLPSVAPRVYLVTTKGGLPSSPSSSSSSSTEVARVVGDHPMVLPGGVGEITCAVLQNWERLIKGGMDQYGGSVASRADTVFTDLFVELQSLLQQCASSPGGLPLRRRPCGDGDELMMRQMISQVAMMSIPAMASAPAEERDAFARRVLCAGH